MVSLPLCLLRDKGCGNRDDQTDRRRLPYGDSLQLHCAGHHRLAVCRRLSGEIPQPREGKVAAELHQRQPIGQMGRPEEIAQLALYICSPAAEFMNGSVVTIDGVWTAV